MTIEKKLTEERLRRIYEEYARYIAYQKAWQDVKW